MRIKILVALLALCMIFSICSCGDNGDNNTGGSTSSSVTGSVPNGGTTDTSKPSEDSSGDTDKPDDTEYHTVTFVTNCDDVIEPILVENGRKATAPANISKPGYTFAGWYLGDIEWVFVGYVITEDTTLVARWIANENVLAFNENGGSGTMADLTVTTDSTVTLTKNSFTRAGYTFKGWATTSNGEVVYADGAEYTMGAEASYTLYAVWEANKNTLVFDANGGSGTMDNLTVATDSTVTLTNGFTKPGYTLMGWATTSDGEVVYTDGAEYTMGTEASYTLYAVWGANNNTLVFDANGGTGTMESMIIATDGADLLIMNKFEKAGYTFIGWATTPNGEAEYADGAEYEMGTSSSYTLYAVWKARANGVVFIANGCSGTMADLTVTTDSTVTLTKNSFTRAGYTFKGWATTSNGEVVYADGAEYTMGAEASYTLYAVWEANKNTLVFDANGGSGTMDNLTVATGNTVTLTNGFTKPGYSFMGWATTADGEVVYADGAEYTMGAEPSYTLYAVWKLDVYTITYEKNGGTGEVKETFTIYDLPITLGELNDKTNYLFNFWYKESDFSGEPVFEITELSNITLYAEYVECTDGLVLSERDGEYTVTGYTGSDTRVVIPKAYKGKRVTSIGDYAFNYCRSITSVAVPNGVTTIGNWAFTGCTALTSIELPNSVTSIGKYAFEGCASVTSIEIPNSVASIGDYAFNYCTSLASVVIQNGVAAIGNWAFRGCIALTGVEIPNSVTAIGANAFFGCTSLTSVVLPNRVTTIGEGLFSGCTALKSIEIPSSVTSIGEKAFYNCTDLASAVMENGVTTIGDYAFYGCTSLASIEIPSGVTAIGEGVFEYCKSLTEVVIPESVTSIDKYAFSGCTSLASVIIGNGVTTIGSYAFNGCTSLASAVIGNGVATIGDYAFNGCTSITNVVIPNGVTTIGNGAFRGCIALTGVKIPNKVITIGNYAFEGCTAFTSIEIPNSVTTLGEYAFGGCTYIASVEMGDGVATIGSGAFYNCTALSRVNYSGTIVGWCNISFGDGLSNPIYYGANLYVKGELITELVIPGGVRGLGDYAFYNYTLLESVKMSNGVATIGSYAFFGCTSLTSVEMPNSITAVGEGAFENCPIETATMPTIAISYIPKNKLNAVVIDKGEIGSDAFRGCASLKSVVMGDGVTAIGANAFYGCSSLESIEMSDGLTSIGDSAFYNCKAIAGVEIPNNVISVGKQAFRNCTSLESAVIGESVTTIGEKAFYGCTDITSVSYLGTVAGWCNISFGDSSSNPVSIGASLYINGEILTEIVIPKGVDAIGNYAFYGLSSLTSIEIPSGVTAIGKYAFFGCVSLASMEIPNGVTTIGDYAFFGCESLTSVDIPNSVTAINDYAFGCCPSISTVVIGENVAYIGRSAFYGCTYLINVIFENPYGWYYEDGTEISADILSSEFTATGHIQTNNNSSWHRK